MTDLTFPIEWEIFKKEQRSILIKIEKYQFNESNYSNWLGELERDGGAKKSLDEWVSKYFNWYVSIDIRMMYVCEAWKNVSSGYLFYE